MLFPLNSIGYGFNRGQGLTVLGAVELMIHTSRLGSALRQLFCPVSKFQSGGSKGSQYYFFLKPQNHLSFSLL